MRRPLALMILCANVLAACKSTGPEQADRYPLAAGNEWVYDHTISYSNFQPVNPGTPLPFDTSETRSTVRVGIVGQETLRDSLPAWHFSFQDGTNVLSHRWHRVIQDTLFVYAYSGPGLALPKASHEFAFVIGNRTFDGAGKLLRFLEVPPSDYPIFDSIIYEQRPPKSLVFPLRIGLAWNFRERGYPFGIGKQVLAYESISLPAGVFGVHKIRWFWDVNNDGMWDPNMEGYDYVNARGLVRRVFLIRAAITLGDPDPIGYIDITQDFALRSFLIY